MTYYVVSEELYSPQAKIVFSHKNQACDVSDFPDAAARAFRDANGAIHLVATHWKNRASVGANFDLLTHECKPIYVAAGSNDPGKFDDQGWLQSFYTPDGQTVYALVSMDFHPYRHNMPCTESKLGCWYSAITFAKSEDGGRHFSRTPGAHAFVAGPLQKFDHDQRSPIGAFVPTNIIKAGEFYYVMVSFTSTGTQKGGGCVLRSSDISDPRAWRAWDGSAYSIPFTSPYDNDSGSKLAERGPCTVVGAGHLSPPVRSLLVHKSGRYLAVFLKRFPNQPEAEGVYYSYSSDLITWTAAKLLLSLKIFNPESCVRSDAPSYWYPSLIDPSDTSLNFENVGSSAFLFLTKLNACTWADRDLVRMTVSVPDP